MNSNNEEDKQENQANDDVQMDVSQASTSPIRQSATPNRSDTPSQRFGTPSSLPRGDISRADPFNARTAPMQFPMVGLASPATPMHGFLAASPAPNTSLNQINQVFNNNRIFNGRQFHSPLPSMQDSMASESPLIPGEDGFDQNQERELAETRIWGTDVNVQTCMNCFRNFLLFYKPYGYVLEDDESYYEKQIRQLFMTGKWVLNIDTKGLKAFAPTKTLYFQLKQYPQEIIPIMDRVINEQFNRNPVEDRWLQVRPHGLEEVSRMRSLDPSNIDQLVTLKGMVVRCSPVIPDLKQAYFRCFLCSSGVDVLIDRGRIEEPKTCAVCKTVGSLEIIHNRCMFADKQLVRLQETAEEIPAGETPHTLTFFAFDDLVDSVRPGDRIEVTGMFRAVPNRPNPKMRIVKSVFKTYLDAVHLRDLSHSGNMTNDNPISENTETNLNLTEDNFNFSEARIQEFRNFASNPNVYEVLVKSMAPSIWELDDVKRGLLCLLFGGTDNANNSEAAAEASEEQKIWENWETDENKSDTENNPVHETNNNPAREKRGGVHQRGDINILLCGDPGTSKSQLLSYVHKITPRGIYTSGKGSSAVGLTASVIRDPETKDTVLESGALVLSDKGVCCIDEFDKMSDQTRAILHEAMEQQTVSITKAGIIATLNARTSILASANPVQSRYNPRLSVVENLKLPPTLLSRFDLIYLVLDKPHVETDRKLAQHLVSLYFENNDSDVQKPETLGNNLVDQQFLKEYIMYAKNNVFPEIGIEAEEVLVRSYLDMRAIGGNMKTISATTRQLESLIRLSQALAKMRLSSEVLGSDVREATRLMRVATQTAATDPRTGTIDMDMITTGRSALDRDLVAKLIDQLKDMFKSMKGSRVTLSSLRQQLLNNLNQHSSLMQNTGAAGNVNYNELQEAVRELEQENLIQFVERSQTVIIR